VYPANYFAGIKSSSAIMNVLKTVFGSVIDKGVDIVDQFVEDKDQAAKLKQAISLRMRDSADTALREQSSIIQSEAGGESWLQRNWRPVLMLVIVTIVANNYIVAPYADAMFGSSLTLDLPERLWDLMTLGVGGYVGGRTAEKSIKTWQQGQVAKKQAGRDS